MIGNLEGILSLKQEIYQLKNDLKKKMVKRDNALTLHTVNLVLFPIHIFLKRHQKMVPDLEPGVSTEYRGVVTQKAKERGKKKEEILVFSENRIRMVLQG